MRPRCSTHRPHRFPRSGAARGFSFAEILFAIMILAIGFIMIAAIFPVAIQQAQSTTEETNGSTIIRGAVSTVQQIAPTTMPASPVSIMPRTDGIDPTTMTTAVVPGPAPVVMPGQVFSFRDNRMVAPFYPYTPPQRDALWNAVKGNMIIPSDPRYAWIAMYRRDGVYTNTGGVVVVSDASYAQLIVFVVRMRNRSFYDAALDLRKFPSDVPPESPDPMTLEPRLFMVDMTRGTGGAADFVTFTGSPTPDLTWLADGSYFVVSQDNLVSPNTGSMNGRIYRVSGRSTNPVAPANSWDLAPGNNMSTGDLNLTGAQTFWVGRGRKDPTQPTIPANANPYEGAGQEIAVYTTFIRF